MSIKIKPLIKWVGGKTQIIDQVLGEFPQNIENYHELFLGGGSVLLGLLEYIKNDKIKVSGSIYAYDFNETLINMYKNIQKTPELLFNEIEKLIKDYNQITEQNGNKKPKNIDESKESQESYYYWIRQSFNKMNQLEKNSNLGSACFIFMNKTCFRGLYREGPNGFNVPFGNYKKPEIINKSHLNEISELIKNVNFIHSSFEESFKNIQNDDFVYLDPPYAPENDKSFVNYTSSGFTMEQHLNLFKLSKKFKFVMSNANVDMVKDEYKDEYKDKKYSIKIISCKRTINSKNPDAKTTEVLIKSL